MHVTHFPSALFVLLVGSLATPLRAQEPPVAPASRVSSEGLVLQHPSQDLRLSVANGTATVAVKHGDARAELHLSTRAFGRAGREAEATAGTARIDGSRLSIARGAITEWFVEDALGFEQGWDVPAKPAGDGEVSIEVAVDGVGARIAENGRSADFIDGTGTRWLHYMRLAAYDAAKKPLPARLVGVPGGLAVRVDDRGAAYPITIDPTLTTVAWSFESDVTNGELEGASTAGDVNGDGYSDFIIGVPDQLVLLFHGSPSGLHTTPDWQSAPPQAGARYGYHVRALGDLNGDGFDDVAISAYFHDGTFVDEGVVYVHLGSGAGLASVPTWTILGGAPTLRLHVRAHAGDVDGDGLADVLVQTEGTTVNELRLYRGSATLMPGVASLVPAPIWTLTAADVAPTYIPAATFNLHVTAAGVGDTNRDGYDDVLVGSSDSVSGGYVLLLRGSPSGPVMPPALFLVSPLGAAAKRYGVYVSGTGDINGDGYADLFVSDIGALSARGEAYVYLSDPASHPLAIFDTAPSQTITGSQVAMELGRATPTGDFDGDGFADLMISGVEHASGTGQVLLFRGGGSALTLHDTSSGPNQPGALFGHNLGGAGDVNGDGYSDLFATALRYDHGETNEGAVFVYHGGPTTAAVQPVLPGRTASLAGTSASRFAKSIAVNGDLDGDGFSDLLVGAPDTDTGAGVDAGRIAVYRGTKDGLESVAHSLDGTVAGAQFGASVAWAGDVNNDGYTDVIAGAPSFGSGPQVLAGRAQLFLGNASTTLGAAVWTFVGPDAGARFGSSVGSAGDVNGDGYLDVVVGAPGTHNGLSERGAAFVFHGSATGLANTPNVVLEGPAALNVHFGASVATAGDVDRDGYSDVVVGAPDYSGPEASEGRVYLFLGGSNGLVTPEAWSADSNVPSAQLGFSVSTAGDVDSDGFADVIAGAPGYLGATLGGKVFTYRGQSGPIPLASAGTFDLGTPGARFGAVVAFAGDLNGDGFSDVAAGAPDYGGGIGRVESMLGGSSGFVWCSCLNHTGSVGQHLGESLAGGGDVDGNGYSDLIEGAPQSLNGELLIYVGTTNYGGTYRVQSRRVNAAAAVDLLCLQADSPNTVRLRSGTANPNDINSTPAGLARVAVEWEMASGAALLDGMSVAHAPFAALPGGGTLDALVSGLNQNERYQWRSRLATTNPFFPHSRWVQLQGNSKHEKKFGSGVDCNGNGISDPIEVAQNPALDCDANLMIDSCQIVLDPTVDCDSDGTLNACELFANDCDGDGCPDDCELTGTIVGCGPGADCNANNVLDNCEITGNPSLDANGDGILDTCQFTAFCFGDGTGTACPCGNSGGLGRGCANSVNANGAVLTVTGVPSITTDTLVLHSTGMPNSAAPSSLYLQGTAQDNGGLGTPIQDGLRCVTGTIVRLGTRPNAANQSQYPDAGNQIISIRGGITVPGTTRYYQVFYRNAATAFCPPGTANWTNGLAVTWHL
ncbi:MAG: VCBS repeat-containing protein [Planctomycetes bacterium]|nr:VCBS repeat-containing protein [Planctomycetota bacterium]